MKRSIESDSNIDEKFDESSIELLAKRQRDAIESKLFSVFNIPTETKEDDAAALAAAYDEYENEYADDIDGENTAWALCDLCKKWRKCSEEVLDTLPEKFFCKLNTWDESKANCSVLEDDYNDDEEEDVDDGIDDTEHYEFEISQDETIPENESSNVQSAKCGDDTAKCDDDTNESEKDIMSSAFDEICKTIDDTTIAFRFKKKFKGVKISLDEVDPKYIPNSNWIDGEFGNSWTDEDIDEYIKICRALHSTYYKFQFKINSPDTPEPLKRKYKCKIIMLEREANKVDENGNLGIHKYVELYREDIAVAKLIQDALDYNVDINASNKSLETPISLAKKRNYNIYVRILQRFGAKE